MYFKKKISNFIFQENAVVKKAFKWPFYVFIILIFIVFVLFLANFFFTFGEKNHDFNRKNYEKKVITLNNKLADAMMINDDLNNRIIELQHKNNVLDSLNKEMLVDLKSHRDEKINLLETVDFYETLMKNDFKKSGLNVLKFRAYKNKVTNYVIYTMLVTCVRGKIFAFNGFYNFNIEVLDESGTKKIIYPGSNQKIKLEFKYFSRVEGKIKLEKNVKINNITVQLFEGFTDIKPSYSSSFRIGKN
jgi:hypothetical protein